MNLAKELHGPCYRPTRRSLSNATRSSLLDQVRRRIRVNVVENMLEILNHSILFSQIPHQLTNLGNTEVGSIPMWHHGIIVSKSLMSLSCWAMFANLPAHVVSIFTTSDVPPGAKELGSGSLADPSAWAQPGRFRHFGAGNCYRNYKLVYEPHEIEIYLP